jgi:phage terminase small subunit
MANARPALTAKQSKFVAEYLVDGNGSRSAVAVGYGRAGAHVTASRLLRNPKVRMALQARQSADATRLSLSREDALQGLLGAIATAREKGDAAAMISGWREVGRMMGYYSPERRQVEVMAASAQAELARFEAMSDAELIAIIGS